MYFVYINEDYLYDEKYREKEFNDNIFSQMLELELYLKNILKLIIIYYILIFLNIKFQKNLILLILY